MDSSGAGGSFDDLQHLAERLLDAPLTAARRDGGVVVVHCHHPSHGSRERETIAHAVQHHFEGAGDVVAREQQRARRLRRLA